MRRQGKFYFERLCVDAAAPLHIVRTWHSFWCCRLALEATGLEPLFQALGLDTDAQSVGRAVTWLKQQGADTVTDLNQLPPGTYTCKELAESLGLPLLQAQRLLSALEGATSSGIHHEAALIAEPFARQVLSSCTRRRCSRSRSLLRQ